MVDTVLVDDARRRQPQLPIRRWYLAKDYDPDAHAYRVRYAIANILRDRVTNEGAFKVCFEMDEGNAVERAVLARALNR